MAKSRYSSYISSKTLWQNEIPSHWQETELRMLFADNKNKNIGLVERNLLSLSYGKLKRKDIDNATGLVPASFEGYQIIEEGFIVLRFTDLQNDKKSLRVGYVEERGIITSAYIGLAPKADINSKYFYYQLHFLDKIKYFYNLGGGVRQSLAFKEFGRETVLIPSKQEQTAIARFLDYKLAKINRFIQKKKQLIKLLNEQKAAIINQAVTKGLDPNAKMKDSGIEWLGEIPEHWEVRKLKYVADVVLGKMLCNEDKGGYFKKPYLKSKNIQWLNVDISDVEEMWFSNSELEIYRLKKGDLVLSEGGEVGKTCMWNDELDECYIQNSAHKVSINNGNLNTYFLYLFNTYGKKGGFDSIVNRVSIAHLTKDKLINIKCLLPPITEQQQIVSYIEKETTIINTTISKIEKELTLTEEYKTALIAEAVTGKIDVRNFVIPEGYEVEIYKELEEELNMVAEDEAEYQNEEMEE